MEENSEQKTDNVTEKAEALQGEAEKLREKMAAMKLGDGKTLDKNMLTNMRLLEMFKKASNAPKPEEKQHAFWYTQPVSKYTEEVKEEESGPINSNTDVETVRKRPLALPDGFEWVELNLEDEADMPQLYTLLHDNYVEDDDNMFRFDYKPEFLLWSMTPPGYKKDWHIGVRVTSSKRLVAFISGIPVTVSLNGTELRVAEINFLCVHKQLRSKRLAPVLIKEVTRRINLCGIWQAVYTAGIVIPKPVASCTYWHRPLDIKKLVNAKFSYIGNRMTIARAQRLYKLGNEGEAVNVRPMEPKDVKGVQAMLEVYLPAFKLHPIYTAEEVAHIFLPKEDIMYTYLSTKEDGTVTDLISFYCLESSVLHDPKIGNLKAAYAYYNFATTVSYKALMAKALELAQEHHFDVFNMLDMMNNQEIFKDLKFRDGDGQLHYYTYNWRMPAVGSAFRGYTELSSNPTR